MNINHPWHLYSWKDKPAYQQPSYPDEVAFNHICDELKQQPPLVNPYEVEELASLVEKAAKGQSFILQAGDCAETFDLLPQDEIEEKIRIFDRMSARIQSSCGLPVVRIGRIAGQYAKPRSFDFEEHLGEPLPVFRGENVHSYSKTLADRTPQPERLLRGYQHSAHTLKQLRSFIKKEKSKIYTSHEGLLLPYESAMTRWDEVFQKFYNLSAHMLWIGDKTRDSNGAHVEYFRGIANPVGIKIGPEAFIPDVIDAVKRLNPSNIAGRVLLITRLGKNNVKKFLPLLIRSVRSAGLSVCWMCDPMHGNTIKLTNQLKTRHFDDVCGELAHTFLVHEQEGSFLSGAHFEITHKPVTECLGGPEALQEKDLSRNYQSYCDPRLNAEQSLAICDVISHGLQNFSKVTSRC